MSGADDGAQEYPQYATPGAAGLDDPAVINFATLRMVEVTDAYALVVGAGNVMGPPPGLVDGTEVQWIALQVARDNGEPVIQPVRHVAGVQEAAKLVAAILAGARQAGELPAMVAGVLEGIGDAAAAQAAHALFRTLGGQS